MSGGEGTLMVPRYPDPATQNVNCLPMDNAYAQSNPLFDRTPPSVPTALTSTGKTAVSISLSWTASTDNVLVDHYAIYLGGTFAGKTTNTTATVSGLTTATAYAITVSAVDEHGNESAKTAPLNVTTN